MLRISRHAILIIALLTVGIQASAQDTILTRSGRSIPAKVIRVQGHRVYYQGLANEDSALKWRDLHFVGRIRCADGRVWPPSREDALRMKIERRDRVNLSKNFSFGFIGMQILGDYGGPAAGAGYERFVDKRLRWSLGTNVSFFAMGFGMGRIPVTHTQLSGFYASPDLQYHLPRFKHRIVLSVGLSVPLGVINRSDHLYNELEMYLGTNDRQYFLASTEAVLALRVASSRSFTFMARMSGGPMISYNADYGGTFRAAFCIGFRY